MTLYVIIGCSAAVVIAIVFILARGWVGTAAKGGADEEARKRLEEMAKREKEASDIKARPVPVDLNDQLDHLRSRLRHKLGRDGN